MAENYFRLTSLEDGNQISIKAVGSPTAVNLQYRTSLNQTWQAYAIGTKISISTNEWIEFRNDTGTFSNSNSNYYNVTMTKAADASGSIMSLLNYNNMDIAVPGWAFYGLFRNCSTLREPPALPATTLGEACYWVMFNGCASLTQAPALPATTLARNCYHNMFQGCTSLTKAPELPATTLATGCYDSMFQDCTALTAPPELPATTITPSCYNSMFRNCTSLTSAPALPSSKMTDYCYHRMFNGCTSLTRAPELPATTLAKYCYQHMFNGCTSLRTAPSVLPATTLADYCYPYMFNGCTSLTTAPDLPATNLAHHCYTNMFNGSGIRIAPKLPATTVPYNAYDGMFRNCVNLIKAADLPASSVADQGYSGMYLGCTNLIEGPAINASEFIGTSGLNATFRDSTNLKSVIWTGSTFDSSQSPSWLGNVSATGTFYYTNPSLDVASIPRNANGIPAGWRIQYLKYYDGILLKINNIGIKTPTLFGKNIASLYINGMPVKS